ncbi:MAG: YmdB family metallophosphoesterase [Chloroflexota bacterium]|nr:YmdB family metallophosphoesterase [Chloroflexota bacterium]
MSDKAWSVLFIGDVVGEAGLSLLEARLLELRTRFQPDFVVVNAENMDLTPPRACGMKPESLARLFALGVDAVTGGNHSWDGDAAVVAQVFSDERVLRPHNYGTRAPGRGTRILERNGTRVGLINLVSKTALAYADEALDPLEAQLDAWGANVDGVLVDFHGESVTEKMMIAYAVVDRVSALVGTHTHVPTLDTRIIATPDGGALAYVSDVGMTGPSGGIQGYDARRMVDSLRTRLGSPLPMTFADGAAELGAVFIRARGRTALSIERVA